MNPTIKAQVRSVTSEVASELLTITSLKPEVGAASLEGNSSIRVRISNPEALGKFKPGQAVVIEIKPSEK